ncbi:MAG TPA: isocitrate/isopropylmalate dehydrogenase family protein [Methanomassiliicoccales archaeon]|nr:isocitrate/isopropylmalate dehydrogenase family protein [Methanomassiliicoccales archaeon]
MKKVVVIKGDGIGKEVVPEAVRVIRAVTDQLELVPAHMGLECNKIYGWYLPPKTLELIKESDSVLFGAITTPIADPNYRSPLLFLRKELDLFANVRPARKLMPNIGVGDLNIVMVRENTEGMYTGLERQDGDTIILERKVSEHACRRVVRYAIELCKRRGMRTIHCIHKANVIRRSDGLFRRVFFEEVEGTGLDAREMLVDAAAAALITKPKEFQCIVTLNLYGDILSDEAAAIVGGLGFTACGNIGDRYSIFEPCHGSAPDIAGQGIANPTATILSATMMLRHLGLCNEAKLAEDALVRAYEKGVATPDAGGTSSTREFSDEILRQIESAR